VDKEILVSGHTDNIPIGTNLKDEFETNWELSTARATSVVRYLADQKVAEEHLMAAGHAEFDPVASNQTKKGRQQNRRIEIVLVPEEVTKP
jgi:Flagellar motor protein